MILIVDDQENNIYALKKLLENWDFEVDKAFSGEEALSKVLKNNYALIILDVQMPGMDGFEVAEALCGYSKTKDIPIIFLSAVNTHKRFIKRGYESGGIDYVTKPVDQDILMLKVKTFYRLYEQTKALNETKQALINEIDERKKVQQQLKDKVEFLNATLESLPQLAFTLDHFGNLDFVNEHWLMYADKLHFPTPHPDDFDLVFLFDLLKESENPLEREVRLKKLDGKDYRYHLLRVIPFKIGHNTLRWVGTFTDIHEQKLAEIKKDEFLSIASHELKTPLTSIKAYVQLLERTIESQECCPAEGYIRKVNCQVEKLNVLIADLLDISKIENGKLQIRPSLFNLEKLIDEVVETTKHSFDHRDLTIIKNGEIIGDVWADEMRIEQVLINYLSNAVKYNPSNNTIRIFTEKFDNEIKVNITDYGLGIPDSKKPFLFNKFYRVEETSMRFQGLGIGLYICSEIINKHNGTVGVESEEGQGSTFYFTLPTN